MENLILAELMGIVIGVMSCLVIIQIRLYFKEIREIDKRMSRKKKFIKMTKQTELQYNQEKWKEIK